MSRIWKVLFLMVCWAGSFSAFAQEVRCNDGIDNDGDGIIDCNDSNCQFAANIERGCNCYDGQDNDNDGEIDQADPDCASYFGLAFVGAGSNCSIVPPGAATPFDLVGAPTVSGQNTADTQSKVAVGDVDGDGLPDVVITSKWNREIRVVATRAHSVDGEAFAPGDIKSDFKTTGQGAGIFPDPPGNNDPCEPKFLLYEHEVLIADIDGDRRAEIFTIVSNRTGNAESPPTCFFLLGFRYQVDDLVPLPGYPVRIGTDRPGIPGIADFDGDGKAEIYLKNRIYAAENGTLLADGGGDWDSQINSAPVAANITGDNRLELICGHLIYTVPNLSSRTLQSLTLFRDMNALASPIKFYPRVYNDIVEYGLDNHSSTSVADIDEDGVIDVLMSGSTIPYNSNAPNQNTAIVYWNVQKNIVSSYLPPDDNFANGWPWGTGRINIGETDGDGDVEASFIAGNKLFNMEFSANRETLNPVPKWIRTINDSRSGVITLTVYDFNNDAHPEVVYRDSQELVVVDGRTGAQKLWSAACNSHTFTEGPIIADVNGDGGTDICVPCYRNTSGVVAGEVDQITVTAQGSGYTAATTTVTITGDGNGATATATIGGSGKITGITVTNPGSGYTTPPTVTITGAGTGAAATATITTNGFDVEGKLQQQALGEVRLFFSSGNEWLPTRKVWNQPGYFVVNINDDLTLPFPQLNQNLIFGTSPCPNGLPGPQMPLNIFLNQIPNISADGCPVFPAPDLTYIGDTPNPNCTSDPSLPGCDTDGDGVYTPAVVVIPPICGDLGIQVYFNIINSGDLPITDNVPVSFFNGDPTANPVTATKLFNTTLAINNLQVGQTLQTPTISFNGPGTAFTLFIVLYNDGSVLPINLTGPSTTECTIVNNMYAIPVTPDPFTVTVEKLSDNFKCVNSAPDNGALRVRIFKGATEVTDYSPYSFQWYSGIGTGSPIASQTAYNATGLAEGDYSVVVTDVSKGCSNPPVSGNIIRTGNDPDIVITVLSDQTVCSPANGKLEANIVGGNTGYTFEWYDISLTPLGITGNIANNLTAGNYVVLASKDGCTKTSPPATVNGPQVPDVQANVLQNVIDCANPNSGSITADALFNGVLQDPVNYTFTWYQYNSVTSTRGSQLAIAHGSGPTRTGLPVGFYQVEVKDNTTQCVSLQTPVVEVVSQTVVPDPPLITQLAAQTSCDPLQPNGVLTADVLIGGVIQNPAGFTFEWFKGQTTLPADKVNSVSDVNGKTVNQVAGGGIPYTVKVTTPQNCSAINDFIIAEDVNVPIVTLLQLTPNSICDPAKAAQPFNGSLQATVMFDGNTVTLPDPNYVFEWRDPANQVIAVADDNAATLGGLVHGNSYSVRVTRTDLFCVSVPDTEPILQATVLPLLSTTSTGSNNCDPGLTPDGTATVAVTNIAPGDAFTFQWYAGNGVVPGNQLSVATNNANQATAIRLGGPTNAPTPYTVEVLNTATGCVNTATQFVADVSVIPVLSFVDIDANDICSPANLFTGRMEVQVDNQIGAIADYQFTWYNGGTTASPVNATSTGTVLGTLDVGTYTVEVVNTITGCASSPITSQVPDMRVFPILQLTSTGSNNCDPALTPDGTVTAAVTNAGTDQYTFQWYDGAAVTPGNELPLANNGTSATAINVGGPTGAPKPYTVLVTNQRTGCSNFSTGAVADVSVVPVISFANVTPNDFCAPAANFNGALEAQIDNQIGAIGDYQFTWYNGATTASPLNNTSTGVLLAGLDVGPYTTEVRNTRTGCVSSPITTNVPDGKIYPILSMASTGSNNCDPGLTPDGTATVAVTNPGTDTYRYLWYSGSTTTPGNELLVPLNNANQATAINLGGPFIPARTYTALVTNNRTNCSSFSSVIVADISVVPVLSLVDTDPQTICAPANAVNGRVELQIDNPVPTAAPGDYVFTWHNGPNIGSPVNATSNTEILAGLSVNFYTATVRNMVTGCESTPFTTQVPDGRVFPAVQVTSTGSNTCDPGLTPDGTITANVTNLPGPFSYAWTALAGAPAPANATAATATNVGGPTGAPTSYEVVVTDIVTGCATTTAGLVADVSEKPQVTLAAFDNTICDITVPGGPTQFDGHVDVTATTHPQLPGAYTLAYAWYDVDAANNATLNGTYPNAAVLPNRDNAKYGVEVTIVELGCTSDLVITEVLDDLAPVAFTTDVDASTNCDPALANGRAEVIPPLGANYAYQWYDGTVVDPGQLRVGDTSPLLGANLQGGAGSNFTVEVINLNDGCRDNEPLNVPDARVIPTISLSVVQHNTICDIATITPDGELLATVGNVGANITITWVGGVGPAAQAGANGEQFINLQAGSYTARVEDDDTGCISTDDSETILDDLTYPAIAINVTEQTNCMGTPNGELEAIAAGPVTYTWYDGIGTAGSTRGQTAVNSGIIDQLPSADYTVHVRNTVTGCESTESEFVPVNIIYPVVSFAAVGPVTSCVTPNGMATASVANLSAPTNYDIFYVFTSTLSGGAYPTDPLVIKASVDPANRANESAPPVAYGNMVPGYLTALVIDNNTQCESAPVTQQIIDNTVKSTITMNLIPVPGICGAGNGGIDATVGPLPPASYTYEWYNGSPNNAILPINFFTNPPAFAGAEIYGDGRINLGINGGDPNINSGTYTLVVYDPDGCGTFKTEFVPTSTVPELDITPTDITRCDVGNGEITVEVAAGTSGTGYSLEIFEGVDNTGVSLASLPLSPINTPLTVSNLDPGTYYIELIDGDNPTCPMGEIQVLSRIVAPPVLSSSIVAPNTSCDPTLGADGEVQLTATSANGDVQAKNYQVTAVSLAIAGFSTPDPIGTGASGQSEVIVNLEPEAYTFTVTDANSSCEADILVVVPDAQDVPSNLNVVPAAETACAPLSNGSATASLAGGEAVTIFDFNWFLNADGTGSVLAGGTPLAGGGGTTGELLNQGKVPAPANWPLGATGFGSGNRTYYVRGVKNATAPSGVGCPTELKQVVIPDEHLSPNIDLTSTFNSFCAALVPGSGDGSISIEADPDGATGAIEAANFTFVLDVDPNGINGTGPVTNVANGAPITIPDLGTGSYEITATNVATGCGVINSIAVQDAPFFIQITDTDFANQLICNPNGQADVVEVTINKTAASLANVVENNGLPLTNVYDFEWFAATPGNPNTFVNTPLEDNANNPINEQSLVTGTGAGQYPTMGAGTYYVIATRRIGSGDAEGCPSLPVRIDVADEHKNPVVTLTPFSNTSCLPGTGEGQIEVTVTDATNPAAPGFAATFDYDWAAIITDSNGNNGNATNDGDDDVIVNLEEANYSVTVTNPTTGCATLGTAEIRKNATPVFVQTVDSTPQVSCDPAGDGSLELTEVSLNDRNGNQQSTALPVPNNLVFGDFEFDWTRVGNPFTQTTAGTVLDVGTYDASGAGFNTPIGAGTYTVVARRINGSPGRDCESAPFQVLIQDNRMYPTATMLPLSNTSCDPAFFEGEILITADDQTSIAGPNSFTYTWTTSATPAVLPVGSVSVASDGDADGTDGDDDHPTSLIEGNYQITVTSLKSQCTNVASTTIFKNATPVFVQQVDSRDQVLCTPDGRLEVTQVTLNDRNGNVQTTPVQLLFNEFEFTWTRTASTLNFTEAPGVAVLDGANFPAASGTIGAGEYFVVAKRIAGSPGRDCESAPYKVDILDRRIFPVATLTPFANTSCDPLFFEGEVAVNVTDASVNLPAPLPGAPFNYSYEWLQSATAALPVGPVPGVHDGDGDASDGDGDHPLALSEGAYRIRVTNIQTGCTADAATTIFRNGTPVFTQQVDATNQVLCGNDGALQITNLRIIDRDGNEQTSGNGDFPVSDFDFEWFRGTPTNSVATGDGNLGAASGGTILDAAHYPAIGFDTYYVVSTRTNGSPGKDCFSTPYKVDILDRRIFPVATLTPFANTSCDPTFFEGAISLRVTDQTTVPGPFTYTYTWDPGNPTAIPLINPGLNDGDADGADGDQDNPGGLEDGVYNVLVRNNQTGCESPAVTTIFRNATPIFIPQATAQPQVLCLADGSVEVDIVEVTDRDGVTQVAPLSDFDFSWSRATLANVVATTVGANGAVSGGTILDATAYNQIGFDAYYIVARRVANGPGLGCESAPYKVDILDRRLFPEVTFVPTANSSCSDLKPNGALQADAREMNGANAGPYIFAWQLDGGAVSPASTQTDTNNSSLLGSALDGVYTVTATNTVTGCPVDANFTLTLDQTRSTPNIIDVNTIDPLDCNPSAQAEVTRITLGGTTNSTLFPPNIPPDNTVTGAALNNFIFEWYDGGFAPSALIAGQTAPLITGLSARTYYVIVQDPATDCKSGPKEVIINDDDIIYPVADIQQTIKQISCTTPGSAELLATGDGQTIIPYTFQWFNSLDLSGPVLANVPQIGQLSAGEYSVNVTNTVTGCSSSAYYIIPDEADLYRPIVSLGGSPRTLCVGEDGSVLARVINLDPTYPFPYTFTADLYNGTPSISTDPNTVPPPADFPNMALVPGFVGNFLQSSLPEGTYTVRLVDNNTGCVTVAVGEVEDERVLPVVEVVELNPLINCDPNRANGQLAATADGGRIVGYTFDWYEGSTVPNPPGTPLEADTDQLIGYGVYGQDVSYVVRVTNNFTQCFSDKAGTITDGTVEPPMPTPETVFDRTNCIDPNGWLTVSVDGVVFNYTFNWYNGTVATGSPAFTGIDYRLLDVGNYAVTATDDVTGCVSPPATLPVLDKRLIPEFNIVTTPSFCVDTGRPNGNGSVILTVTNNAILTDVQWYDVNSNANVASGTAYYELFPGVYRAEVVTNEGCTNEGTAEVGTEIAPYNGISSNGDNLNDFFIIDCITNFPNNNVKIYNRSGILVYEVDGYNNADLSFKGIGERGVYLQGTDLPVGTYFYIIDKRDGSKPVAGYLELDR